ncbi:MAG: bis-aminopropyl spermidine synthase family protein [Alphaproteobacteria bacterium]
MSNELLRQIAEATALREGPEGVAAVVRAVYRLGPLRLRDLAGAVRVPLPVVGAVRRELEKAGLLERGQGLRLSAEGRTFAETVLGLGSRLDPTCPACGGAGLVVAPALGEVAAMLAEHVARGPKVDTTLDQAPCTPDTALRRALAMHAAGAVDGRAIVFLGDDDSVSVAVALLARHIGASPRRLTVLEVDPGRLAHLEGARRSHGLDIDLVEADLRSPLPEPFREAFDVFETDPPYTLDGMTLFVSRGIEALRRTVGLPGFLSFAELAPGDTLDLQRRLFDMGLAIVDVRRGFNRYEGAAILGSSGQFLSLLTTPRTRSGVGEGPFTAAIHTGEVRPRVRLYRCAGCAHTVAVGQGEAVDRIETLKERGCPRCGGGIFRRLSGRGGAGQSGDPVKSPLPPLPGGEGWVRGE